MLSVIRREDKLRSNDHLSNQKSTTIIAAKILNQLVFDFIFHFRMILGSKFQFLKFYLFTFKYDVRLIDSVYLINILEFIVITN